MRIKLILSAPPHDPLREREPFMPLALPLLAAAAPDHDYEMIDMLRDTGPIDYDAPVDLVGISARLTGEPYAYEVADEFRRRGVPVVVGGPQISAVPFRAIEHADAVVVGEGEELWPVVLADAAAGRLKSFYVCRPTPFDGRGREVHQIFAWPDLQKIPRARRELMPHRYQFDTVFASRGCPIDCDFCGVPAMFGHHTRLRPIADVVAEIDTFADFFYLIDDTVFGRPNTYAYYLELYWELARLSKRRFWTGQANLGAVDSPEGRDVIRAAVRAGLLYVAVGMESINPATLRKSGAISKTGLLRSGDPIARMKEQISFLQDLGLIVSGWFAIGYEDDTIETFYTTLEFCSEAGILPVLSPVNALPGTRLFDRLRAEGGLDWSSSLTNVTNPRLRKDEVIQALDAVVDRGYAVGERLKRTVRLVRSLSPRYGNTPEHVVKATVYSLVLQHAMSRIFYAETRNLESPQSQNYYTEEPPL
jgi:radical SAM superfamily enzyme YgiQ (UPF0313 family)